MRGTQSLNLVHVLPYYAPAWSFGGVVRAAHGLTAALAAAGHQVTVVTTDAAGQGRQITAGADVLDAVRVVRCHNWLPVLRYLNLSSPPGMYRVLRNLIQTADVVHVHEFRTMENLFALALARRFEVPVVMSPHGTLGYGAGRSAVKKGWDALLGQWTASRIRHVAALTEDEAADVRALWGRLRVPIPDDRVSVIPNGVDPAAFVTLPPRERFRQRWGIPLDALLVLFLGRLHVRKGAHHLVDALQNLPDVWLALVGPDEGQRTALQESAARHDVADRVVFTGMLDGPDKLAALAGADVLALPAVGEGLPMVALEAMAAGLPVALSDECHLESAFAAGAGIRLDPLTGESVAAALHPLLHDSALRQRMGQRGRELVNARYTWASIASLMGEIYAAL
jgi:glycosyltransferase involved in cell wall biosynthesis